MTLSVPVARRVRTPVSDAWVKKIITAALRGAKAKNSTEVGVVFVSDREMIKLNTVHRRKKKTTDVLSFSDGEHGMLGDIVVSVAQAERQAREAGKPLRAEIAMLLVHGTLHLLGYDHATLEEEKTMFGLQNRILKTLSYV